MKTFWMSFCDINRPEGEQFLGVVIMQGKDLIGAVQESHKLGINPGGEIKLFETDPVRADHMNRLLSNRQLKEYGYI